MSNFIAISLGRRAFKFFSFYLFRMYESNCPVTIIFIFYIIVCDRADFDAVIGNHWFFMRLVPFYTCLAVFHLLVSERVFPFQSSG